MRPKKKEEEFAEVKISLDEPVFTSGVVARLLDIPIWVLKQLDQQGIVSPKRENTSQSRLYSKRELKQVKECWYFIRVHKVKIPGLKLVIRMQHGSFDFKEIE